MAGDLESIRLAGKFLRIDPEMAVKSVVYKYINYPNSKSFIPSQ